MTARWCVVFTGILAFTYACACSNAPSTSAQADRMMTVSDIEASRFCREYRCRESSESGVEGRDETARFYTIADASAYLVVRYQGKDCGRPCGARLTNVRLSYSADVELGAGQFAAIDALIDSLDPQVASDGVKRFVREQITVRDGVLHRFYYGPYTVTTRRDSIFSSLLVGETPTGETAEVRASRAALLAEVRKKLRANPLVSSEGGWILGTMTKMEPISDFSGQRLSVYLSDRIWGQVVRTRQLMDSVREVVGRQPNLGQYSVAFLWGNGNSLVVGKIKIEGNAVSLHDSFEQARVAWQQAAQAPKGETTARGGLVSVFTMAGRIYVGETWDEALPKLQTQISVNGNSGTCNSLILREIQNAGRAII
jgi:hypothetical protein